MDHDGHPLAITAADAVAASGVPPWNWRETPGNGKLCRDPEFDICLLTNEKRENVKKREKISFVWHHGFLHSII